VLKKVIFHPIPGPSPKGEGSQAELVFGGTR